MGEKLVKEDNMGGEVCHQIGRERGPWYAIKCVADVIKSKESKGQDANFERNLLKSWSKYEGYEEAKQTLADLGKPIP